MGLQEKIDLARRELLDLTLRNPLLNYRTLKKKGLEITDEKTYELYKLLVEDGKTMAFLSEESLIENPEDETPEHLELINKTYSDLKLQTRYSEKDLQDRLLNTHLTAKTFIEERGVNTLFLALGMLIWEEDGAGEKQYRAPLILVPVTLSRSNARERFLLTYSEEDIQLNVSLAAKLLSDFHIKLDFEVEEPDISAYFRHVREAVASRPHWRVGEDEIVLGFFSFGKYLMYLDLDSTRWPTQSQYFNNEILKSLLEDGFKEDNSPIGENSYIDPYLLPKDTYHIMDADSSQTVAILDINNGRNMVIQGPPGTGKSQTITNVIAESVARGKKVLFVSEKLAALEVVKRRLANAGLGDVCLELHSQKANKKNLLSELQKTMELGNPKINDMENRFNEYVKLRDELTLYCESMNEPVPPSGLTPIRIYGKLINLRNKIQMTGLQLPRLQIREIENLNDIEYENRALKIKELQNHLQKMGPPKSHPYYGCTLKIILPAKKEIILERVNQLQSSFENLLFVLDEMNACLNFQASQISDAEKAVNTLETCVNKPDTEGFNIPDQRWVTEARLITGMIQDGIRIKEIFSANRSIIMDELYGENVLQIRQVLAANQGKLFKFLSSEYKKASKFIEGFLKTPQKTADSKKLAILDDVLEFNRIRQYIEAMSLMCQELFTAHFKGYWNTDWVFAKKAADFILRMHQGVCGNEFINEISSVISDDPRLKEAIRLLPALKDTLNQFLKCSEEFNKETGMKIDSGINTQSDDFSVILGKVEKWQYGIESVFDIAAFNQYADELSAMGLNEIVELSEVWKSAGEFLSDMFENERCQALLTRAFQERPDLTRFDSAQHQQKIARFIELDKSLMNHNIIRLLYEHWKNKPKPGQGQQGQMGVLLREFQKKTRHMPIRKLMTKAGFVIQVLKPVMMMSPLSIANFIEPGQLSFDIAIFDEASQVRPVEAFGALMRSGQAVVVGDSQQMPPTNFFDKTIGAVEETEDDEYVGDVESILGLFLAQNSPQRMLRWHYRSRHESLITVSNKEFYKNRLVVFPSCVTNCEDMGLLFHHLKDTVYDRGNTQTNRKEAQYVAGRVMRHAKENPELTLGVAAFSIQQMQAIIDELEILRRLDSSVEGFFQAHSEEPFFVKNLENVQGDERDIIFISIGYGRDKDGALTMSFGPLNRDGGERRLNVLITRARQKCEVFSSITGDDIDLSRTSSRGVTCLKTYLTFAEKGFIASSRETDREADSEFEQQIYETLTQKGYTVHKQVGCSDFYIDLAIIHPDDPGRYLLGIECDGAAYHSARSAKDRDRLRQAALERKGWNIYRIWSTDWFRSPNTELSKLEQYMDKLLNGDASVNETDKQKPVSITIEREDIFTENNEDNNISVEPYIMYRGREINDELIYQPAFLSRLLFDIIKVENPVHKDELIRRVLGLTGLGRAGSRIQNAFEAAISSNLRRGILEERGSFLYGKGLDIKLRYRNDLPSASKKMEYVTPEEIALAVKAVIKNNFGMQHHEIPLAAARILGFARTTEDMVKIVSIVLLDLEKKEEIKKQGDTYI